LQTPIAQQPVGQVAALQATATQLPPMHLKPAPQAGDVPQTQLPVTEQPLAISGSHAVQAAPFAPHAVAVRAVVQVEPAQHPLGQFAPLHVFATHEPETQRWFAPQAAPDPHRQLPPVHESAALALQATHAAPAVPQVEIALVLQTPAAQQPVGQEAESQTHCPPAHRVPGPHAGPVPQAQLPWGQPSARAGSQAWQAAPGFAQLESD
jgi:hypothetical protein